MDATKSSERPAGRDLPRWPAAAERPPRAGWGHGAASAWQMLQRQELNRQLVAPRG